MDSRYSFSLTTFSPSGKLVQIEYALNAVNAGATALGIKGMAPISFVVCIHSLVHLRLHKQGHKKELLGAAPNAPKLVGLCAKTLTRGFGTGRCNMLVRMQPRTAW